MCAWFTKEAQFLLKYGADSEGYQDSNKFMQQVKYAVEITELKYPSEHYNYFSYFIKVVDTQLTMTMHWLYLVWMSNQVVVSQKMRDKVYDGVTQWMVFDDGTPKGMKQVLIEHYINVKGMCDADMQHILSEMREFKYEKQNLKSIFLDET